MKTTSLICRWFLIAFMISAALARGQVMLSPAAAFTELGAFNPSVSVTNLINQSGITTPFVSGVTVFDTYFANPGQRFATSGDGGTNNWNSQQSFTDLNNVGYVDFDLGAVYQINKVGLWNRSISNLTVTVRETLEGPQQVAGNFSVFDRQNFPFSYGADVLPLTGTYQGRYVRFVLNGIYPAFVSPGFTFGYAIMGEVVMSVVPQGTPRPTLSIDALSNGDVRISFTGTLQSATNVNGVYSALPGNPASPFLIPKIAQHQRQFFRAVN